MESFVFYTHYAKKMKKLSPEQAANLLFAICDYVENGKEPELDDTAADMCFSFIRTQLDRDIAKYEETCKKRAAAGRKGAAATNGKRRQASAKAANAEFAEQKQLNLIPIEEADEKSQEPENTKKKTPKKVKYGDYVSMTEAEHQKFLDEYGPEITARLIEVLDNYKGSKGKTYKSDYRAILSWVVDRVKEEKAKRGGNYGGANSDRRPDTTQRFTPSTGFRNSFISDEEE